MRTKVTGGGGSGGGNSITGLSSDNQTPGGIVVAGAVNGGNSNATVVPTFHTLYGATQLFDSQGNEDDWDSTLFIEQQQGLSSDSHAIPLFIARRGALNGHDYLFPIVMVADDSGSTADLQAWRSSGTEVALINQHGGLGLFEHSAPTAPRTLAQSVINAITDTNAKTAIQAVANALADMGVLTLT